MRKNMDEILNFVFVMIPFYLFLFVTVSGKLFPLIFNDVSFTLQIPFICFNTNFFYMTVSSKVCEHNRDCNDYYCDDPSGIRRCIKYQCHCIYR